MQQHCNFRNGQLFYSIKGNGKCVVLLHGFLEDHSIWNDFSNELSENYKVISIDLPGFGKSSVFSEIHSMNFMAEAVNQVLKQEKINNLVLCGHSMGGYISLAFAELYPEKLNGLVLFHSQAAADTKESILNRNRTIEIVKNNHIGFIHSFIPTLFAENNVSRFTAEIENLREVSLKTKREGIIAALSGMRDRKDSLRLIGEVEFPICFIVGKQDSKIALPTVLEQIKLPLKSEALILENVGHMGFIEARDTTCQALKHFIERYS